MPTDVILWQQDKPRAERKPTGKRKAATGKTNGAAK